MAVATTTRIQNRPFRAFEDPGLPQGLWVAATTLSGDASGGLANIQVLFQLSAEPLSGLYYNLEQWSFSDDGIDSGGPDIEVNVVNLDFVTPATPIAQWSWGSVRHIGAGKPGNSSNSMPRPLFLGTPNAPGNTAQVIFGTDNVNGSFYRCVAQGYIWGPRSVLAPGGLRRPVDGIYG